MNKAVISSAGSTQNEVLAAPPQANSPIDDSTLVSMLFWTTEKPRSKSDTREGRLREQRAAKLLEVNAAGQVIPGHVAQGVCAE